jgi:16S rRNA (adenine1518-N6/adenine1519-N6)-dimethyltransferase
VGKEEGEGSHLPQTSGAATRRILEKHGLKADKRLGQHFLVSDRVVREIVERAAGCSVLEIGPGIGVLTTPLTGACPHVTAVELDPRFVEVLADVAPRASVVRQDALDTDFRALLSPMQPPRCIVSNMPYNITGPLLGKVAECRDLLRSAVLMMQKEVGNRVLAGPGTPDRGSLSVAMQLQFEMTKVCDAKAGAFLPPPKVDSVVLELIPRAEGASLDRVLRVVKAGFTQPRKTLANNLTKEFDRSRIGLPENVRPHQLSNEEWIALAERL